MAKKNPFEEDLEGGGAEAAADKAAVAKVRERAAEAEAAESTDPDEVVEIDVDKAEEDLDEAAAGPDLGSRRDRKRNRFSEANERARLAEERLAQEREASASRERQTTQLLQTLQQSLQKPAPPVEDPLDRELGDMFREQDMIYAEYLRKEEHLSQTQKEEYAERARNLQKRMVVVGGKIALRDSGASQGVDEGKVRAAVVAERLHSEHSDVMRDARRKAHAHGAWQQLIAIGKPDNWETLDEAMEMTRKQFGIPSKRRAPLPSDSYKRKLSGIPRGSGAGGADRTVVTMGKDEKKMANTLYEHIPNEQERYKRWAAGPGKRLLAKNG